MDYSNRGLLNVGYSMREEMSIKFQPYFLGYLEIFIKRNLTSFYLSPKLALSSKINSTNTGNLFLNAS